MKNYENNMADQDLIVHSLRVLSDIKNPALTQLKREVNTVQKNAIQIAQKNDRYWKELSSDNIITPVEKKIIQREMESIANSYTALYTQAVAEHYDQADFFIDYMATYNALREYIYSTLQLFNNMEANTEVDREEFNEYFSDYYYSENFTIVSMTVGIISQLGFKILTSLDDEGEDGDIGLYHGALYQYVDNEWKLIDRELYFGKSTVLPPSTDGRYFLCTVNALLDDVLYLNDGENWEPFEVNGEVLTLFTDYDENYIYVYEDYHWDRKEPDEDYRYIVAMGDYYSEVETFPAIFRNEVEIIAEDAVRKTYQGPSLVPPQDPQEGDFFLYIGQTSLDQKWIQYNLYIFQDGEWTRLDEQDFSKRDYFMQALQDILRYAPATEGYFSKAFCDSFFANQASLNALSTKVIFLDTGGMIKSNVYTEGTTGLKIDAAGNIDANQNTHIGGKVAIGVPLSQMGNYDIVIGGNAKIKGTLDAAGGTFTGALNGATGNFTGQINATSGTMGNLTVNNDLRFNAKLSRIYGGIRIDDSILYSNNLKILNNNFYYKIQSAYWLWNNLQGRLRLINENIQFLDFWTSTLEEKTRGWIKIIAENTRYDLEAILYIYKINNNTSLDYTTITIIVQDTDWNYYRIVLHTTGIGQENFTAKLYDIGDVLFFSDDSDDTLIGNISWMSGWIGGID